jgi:hypothetical protein
VVAHCLLGCPVLGGQLCRTLLPGGCEVAQVQQAAALTQAPQPPQGPGLKLPCQQHLPLPWQQVLRGELAPANTPAFNRNCLQ